MYKFFLIFLFLLNFVEINSQEIPIYFKQYLNNPYLINPAFAGSRDYKILHLSSTQILEIIHGSPKTQILSYHQRIRSFETFSNSGIGAYIFNDINGPLKKMGVQLSYSYHITLDRTSTRFLSFGLSVNAFSYSINYGNFNIYDPIFSTIDRPKSFVPDGNVGVYYYAPKLYAGFSITRLLQSPISWSYDSLIDIPIKRNYFTFVGYKFLVQKIIIEPSIFWHAKKTRSYGHDHIMYLDNQFDLNLRIHYKSLTGGVSHTLKKSTSFLGQYNYRKIYAGIVYNYFHGTYTANITGGTVEIFVGINIR